MEPAKILYFIAGKKPTTDEQAAINAISASEFTVEVRTNLYPAMYGNRAETCDYVAGTIPATHNAKPVWNGAILAPSQALITNGTPFSAPVSIDGAANVLHLITPTIADGAIVSFTIASVV